MQNPSWMSTITKSYPLSWNLLYKQDLLFAGEANITQRHLTLLMSECAPWGKISPVHNKFVLIVDSWKIQSSNIIEHKVEEISDALVLP